MNIPSLTLLLKEIVKLEAECQFDLICTGGANEEVLSLLRDNSCEYIFKRGCLFKYHPEKYTQIGKRFPLIKGVYFSSNDVLSFLRKVIKAHKFLGLLN